MMACALVVGILWGPVWPLTAPDAPNVGDERPAPPTRPTTVNGAGRQPGAASPSQAVGTSGTPAPRAWNGHVRPFTVRGVDPTELLDAAVLASPTVRRLLAALEGTDVVVFVESSYRPDRQSGALRLAGCAHGTRWLHIVVDRTGDMERQIGWLAHELQHAVEVAGTPEVQDATDLEQLYKRIGFPVCSSRFETTAACEVGQQAWREALAARKENRQRK